MKKDKSYSELMKACAMTKNQSKESFMNEVYVDMLLQEVLLTREKDLLSASIDAALDARDETTFNQLAKKYVELQKKLGL
ncbi:IDEAL domain-containing protein [Falsibacillus albus]|uniref:IDEAL domain-containing protein n=1 Tax=Falsibacillus albus TaxID=2478915 RepID=A0A3L7K4S6_9BACI|nr:IDEAL domain-containing protein [Falsibacillus albus]RLQ97264.1 IDEAL domain-containing protein [Falsibacillus albus]